MRAEGPFPGAGSRLPSCLPQRKAAPWAQGPPSTSPREPWAPAPSSSCARGPLDETVATTFQEGRGSSVTPTELAPCKWHSPPRARQWLRGAKASGRPAGGMRKGGPAGLRMVCQHFIKQLWIAKCGVSPSFLCRRPALPLERGEVPSSLLRRTPGRGEERARLPSSCCASAT